MSVKFGNNFTLFYHCRAKTYQIDVLIYLSRRKTGPSLNSAILLLIEFPIHSKWFEPRSISSSYSVIVRLSVVLKRTVVGDNNSSFQNYTHPDDHTIRTTEFPIVLYKFKLKCLQLLVAIQILASV